jgi:site-specific DNA recombinase
MASRLPISTRPQIEPRLKRRSDPAPQTELLQRAALYTRVSTEMQVEAESLGTQEKQLREYCSYQKIVVHDLYTDAGISGAHTENRPAFQKMMKDAREGKFNVVIVAKIDRISRNLADLLDLIHTLEDHHVDFVSISQQFDTSTPMGRLTLNILGSFAQFERDIIAERTRENMIERAKKGKWNGGVVPYGFKVVEDHLEPEPSEAEFVRMMYREYLRQRSLRSVAIMVNARDAKPRFRNSFTGSSVKRILTNPIYRGAACYNKRRINGTTTRERPKSEWVVVDDALPKIVAPDVWHEVNRLLETNDGIKPAARASDYLLSGLLRCGKCGMHMQGRKRTNTKGHTKRKKTYYYYVCYNYSQKGPEVCDLRIAKARRVEDMVVEALSRLAANPGPVLRRAEKILQSSVHDQERLHEDYEAMSARLEEIDVRLSRLGDGFEDGMLEKEEYARRARALRSERNILFQQLDSTKAKLLAIKNGAFDQEKMSMKFDLFREAFSLLPINEQKQVLHDLIDHIVVQPNGDLDIFVYQPVIKEAFDEVGCATTIDGDTPLVKITMTPPEREKPPLKPLSDFPTFAKRLPYLRERERLTKSLLAQKLEVHECSVANWEMRNIPPSKPIGRKLAEFFGVKYADLLGIPPVDESLPPWDRLKPLREYLGYTAREFAKLLGLSPDRYNQMEYRPERVRIVTEEVYREMKRKANGKQC